GAHSESENGSASGAVYAYQKQNSSWDHKEQKIIATDGEVSDGFGFAVSIDGDSVIVGTPGDDDKGDSSGSIYTY
ncbi:MAG: FG-GAP repeat protein, partial [Deltaproteobacteria bacterium]|nr:FG-GAP repeat protein [Deltaproteobacteria bacterium]